MDLTLQIDYTGLIDYTALIDNTDWHHQIWHH
jgi:hypothetical protein